MNIGDRVLITTYPKRAPNRRLLSTEVFTIVEVYDQKRYPGGVSLDRPYQGFHSWNEDSLLLVEKKGR